MGRCVELGVGGDRRGAGTRGGAPPARPEAGRTGGTLRERVGWFMQGKRAGRAAARVGVGGEGGGTRSDGAHIFDGRVGAKGRRRGCREGQKGWWRQNGVFSCGSGRRRRQEGKGAQLLLFLLGEGVIKEPGCRPGNKAELDEWLVSREGPRARKRRKGASRGAARAGAVQRHSRCSLRRRLDAREPGDCGIAGAFKRQPFAGRARRGGARRHLSTAWGPGPCRQRRRATRC